eukprot:TRINITY_DN2227_c0_g1_i2.p2 TRINITY_DN2227_c0_g1~~TRINITY_DN2227_c0_g1_i2.p2  ORF type:complete len:138 (+),score=12.37 TRINITY_DN2227_c0_g1_i2:184-597(+)
MVWQQVQNPESGFKPYWYDDSAPDQQASVTWDSPTQPAADGTFWAPPPPAAAPYVVQQAPTVVYRVKQPPCYIRYRMNAGSWCLVILLILFFWPLCWLPCVCEACQEPYEVETMTHGACHQVVVAQPSHQPHHVPCH